MAFDLAGVQARATTLIQDADANLLIPAPDMDEAARQGLAQYSNDTPASIITDLSGDGVTYEYTLPTGFVDGLRAQLESVWEQAWYVTWRNFVHESFSGEQGDKANRQRRLLLDLGERADWVDLTEVATLTPQLSTDYGGRTSKTLQRDINDLELRNLVERDSKRVRARREIILSYLPPKRRDQAPS